MSLRLRNNTKKFLARIERANARALEGAATELVRQTKRTVNKSAGPQRKTRTRNTSGGVKGSSYTVYGSPSDPGSPPHKRTGHLQANIVRSHYDQVRKSVSIGWTRNAIYGFFHEVGIRGRKRPHLVRTFMKTRNALSSVYRATFKRIMP